MGNFFATEEMLGEGHGFSLYDSLHLSWLVLFLVLVVVNCIWYKKAGIMARSRWKKILAILILTMEIVKNVVRLICGTFGLGDLPFHLCGINVFMILIHAWKPNKIFSNFLYMACIPGAMAALLFPDWTQLPLLNFMHLHSSFVHIFLALYPIVVAYSGELAPNIKDLPKTLLLLIGLAAVMFGINLWWGTNFMFLMDAGEGNPLYFFEQLWGNHLYGFPILVAAIVAAMYIPLTVLRKIKNKNPIG